MDSAAAVSQGLDLPPVPPYHAPIEHGQTCPRCVALAARGRAANRYLNLLRAPAKRRYGFAYLAWLKVGAVGLEPSGPGCSVMARQAVRLALADILGPEPFAAVQAVRS